MMAVPPGLTVTEAQILELLRGGASRDRAVAIGVHRRAWTPEDVDDVVAAHLTPPADGGHAVWRPQPFAGATRDVVLTPRLVDVLEDLCAGLSYAEIAAAHNRSENTIAAQVKALIRKFEARDSVGVIVQVHTGRARVLVPIPKRRKAAR